MTRERLALGLDDLWLCGAKEPFYLNEGEEILWVQDNEDGGALVRIRYPNGDEQTIDAEIRA